MMHISAKTDFTDSKQRIVALDGLRGVAAVMVVLYHLVETYQNSSIHIINHAYLAVDFFFILSGYVVSYAYDSRWDDRFGVRHFFTRRLVRLQPMVVFATLWGGLLFYFQMAPAFPLLGQTKLSRLLLAVLMGMLFIPTPAQMDIRGWGEMFCLNSPQWTLAWEYLANIMYALFLRKLSNKGLGALTVFAALLTILLSFNIDVFGFLGNRDSLSYTVIGGWCLNSTDIYVGFSRLLFPFCCGMLIQRMRLRLIVPNAFAVCAMAIIGLFFVPKLPGTFNGLFECVCILFLFPLIIMIGSADGVAIKEKSEEKGRNPKRVCLFLGELSYPLYITHFPLVYIQASWVSCHPNASFVDNLIVTLVCLICIFVVAVLSHRFVEKPICNALNGYIGRLKTN